MNYRVAISANARADIHEVTRWLEKERSAALAESWLEGLYRALKALETHPERCPLAMENDKFAFEIRELLHGRSKRGKYRIVFEIIDDTVYILYVRHSARDEIEP